MPAATMVADRAHAPAGALAPRAIWAYGALVALAVFCLTRGVVLVNDGHVYMEMARSALHGSLELQNGLEITDSPELWVVHTVQRGRHLYPKYPPFYGLLAALPFAALGVRGLYALNALALAAAFPAFHRLARRLLPPRRADLATLLLPFGTPIVTYGLMELPHLVTMAAMLWAAVFWDESARSDSRVRAAWSGLACGLLSGIAFGVRVQSFVLFAALFAAGVAAGRHRRAALAAMGAAFALCVAVVGAVNVVRFGSLNPFSYGPPVSSLVAQPAEESAAYFAQPSIVAIGVVVVAVALGARAARSARGAILSVAVGAALILAAAPLRHQAARIATTLATLTVSASIGGGGWTSPITTLGWMNKALLVSAPFLVLGLVAVVRCVARPASPLETALAWMALVLVGFISLRDPDSRGGLGAMGFLSLSPRYLVEVMPVLYLLGWSLIDSARLTATHALLGLVASALVASSLWALGPGDGSPLKVAALSDAPLALALLLGLAACASPRPWLAGVVLGPLVALAHASSLACVVAEDARALVGIAAQYDRWGERFLAVTPPRLAVVGWWFAKDPIFHLRAARDVVTVDPAVDDGASLADMLDALEAGGRMPFYFGLEVERAVPHLLGRYRVVQVLTDPLVFRLERTSP